MTTFDKLREMQYDTEMVFASNRFEEFLTISAAPKMKMVSHRMWRASVVFYIHIQNGVLRQEADFINDDFEALVEQVWATHQEIHSK